MQTVDRYQVEDDLRRSAASPETTPYPKLTEVVLCHQLIIRPLSLRTVVAFLSKQTLRLLLGQGCPQALNTLGARYSLRV